MRIVRRKEFLALPPGTVYSHYEPCAFRDLCVKGESLSNDWFYVSLEGAIDCNNTGEMFDACEAMEKTGASATVDFETESRDGCYEEDQLFAIYQPADVDQLIARCRLRTSA